MLLLVEVLVDDDVLVLVLCDVLVDDDVLVLWDVLVDVEVDVLVVELGDDVLVDEEVLVVGVGVDVVVVGAAVVVGVDVTHVIWPAWHSAITFFAHCDRADPLSEPHIAVISSRRLDRMHGGGGSPVGAAVWAPAGAAAAEGRRNAANPRNRR